MADRITQVTAGVEYINVHKDKITQVVVQAECVPVHISRVSQVLVMVEWAPPPEYVRRFGPAVQ